MAPESLLLPKFLAECQREKSKNENTEPAKTIKTPSNLQILKIEHRIRNGAIELIVVEIAPRISKNKNLQENEQTQQNHKRLTDC